MLYIYWENNVFYHVAVNLYFILILKNVPVKIVNKLNHDDAINENNLFIIMGMNDYSEEFIPINYIVVQLEQTNVKNSQWFNNLYIQYLQNAKEIWEYSLVNYKNLVEIYRLPKEKIKYMPIMPIMTPNFKEEFEKIYDFMPTPTSDADDVSDILFIGSLNERRQNIINNIKRKFPQFIVRIETNIWGKEKIQVIIKSRMILNLHYYDDKSSSILETVRLSEIIQYLRMFIPISTPNPIILSERSCDLVLDRLYEPFVSFFNNEEELYSKLRKNLPITTTITTTTTSKFSGIWNFQLSPYITKFLLRMYPLYEEEIKEPEPIESEKFSIDVSSDKIPRLLQTDFKKADTKITDNNELVLKLSFFAEKDLPCVSIITLTLEKRDKLFEIAQRNWALFDYPAEKMEWIIVGDHITENIQYLIDNFSNIYFIETPTNMTISQKRNIGVSKSHYDYIVHMDDDDYYYTFSIYARIATLLTYPSIQLVGVNELDIYDKNEEKCYKIISNQIAEASMTYHKSFWREKNFSEKIQHSLGEGYGFTKGRIDRILTIPSAFCMIAITHKNNFTLKERSLDRFKYLKNEANDSLLYTLDPDTREILQLNISH